MSDSDYVIESNIDESTDSSESEECICFIDSLDEYDYIELMITVYELTSEYIDANILQMANPKFNTEMIESISELLIHEWVQGGILDDTEENVEEIYDFVESCIEDYYELGISKPRSYKTATIIDIPDRETTSKKIEYLLAIEQPEQRTKEWYEFRHSLITASSLSKCFGSESQQNSLIYEKCKPLEYHGNASMSTESAMHWGQKFEPVSSNLYCQMYSTRLSEFGCIRHREYSYIGASPDGINTDPESERYGRLVEIKNPVNRELTGIPKEEYWVQMQIQMETCNLDECDFFETVFKDYSETEFYEDTTHEYRGVILYFVQRISVGDINAYVSATNSPKYEYMPLDIPITRETVEEWIGETRMRLRRDWSLYETQYWYLADYSCITVPRSKEWFCQALPRIEEVWNTILKERDTGYEHRASKKRILKTEVVQGDASSDSQYIKNMPVVSGVCLVKLDHV
jgi:putative phage-type endonuclease